jgi:SOS-response transcriptional repressor LexA
MTALPLIPLSAKIREAIKKSGRTKADIARELGVTKQSITGWVESGRISKGNLLKLAELLQVDINWLMDDASEQNPLRYGKLQLVPNTPPATISNVSPVALGKRAIPVISAIQAGALKEIAQPYEAGDGYATVFADDEYSKWAFALEIEGESMLPEFRPGDIVIIEPEWQPRPGEYVAAKNGHEEATFKKYRPRGTAQNGDMIFELSPLNDDYPTMRSDITPLKIIGVMAEHRRKARRR